MELLLDKFDKSYISFIFFPIDEYMYLLDERKKQIEFIHSSFDFPLFDHIF